MTVVAGWCSSPRALLALFPALTTGFPIKKWAAAAALAAALFYLLRSGAEVATQRSFFMTAVVLIAVMVDRRAMTFRTLAVAAMIVLVLAPEALVHPSFSELGGVAANWPSMIKKTPPIIGLLDFARQSIGAR
jgi:competence protein ComEC